MTSEYRHTPVLLAECLEYLELQTQHVFVDATLGGAGHSFEAAKHLGREGTLIGIDQDEVALAAARAKLETLPEETRPNLELLRGNFGDLDSLLTSAEVPGIDAILFDLGVSSVQIDTPPLTYSPHRSPSRDADRRPPPKGRPFAHRGLSRPLGGLPSHPLQLGNTRKRD